MVHAKIILAPFSFHRECCCVPSYELSEYSELSQKLCNHDYDDEDSQWTAYGVRSAAPVIGDWWIMTVFLPASAGIVFPCLSLRQCTHAQLNSLTRPTLVTLPLIQSSVSPEPLSTRFSNTP